MPIEVTMPRLSDTMQEGTLIKWRVQVGDKVKAGDLLADVETDKATMELQSFEDGTVARLAVQEGEVAAVGKPILVLAAEGESLDAAPQTDAAPSSKEAPTEGAAATDKAEAPTAPAEGETADEAAPAAAPTSGGAGGERVRSSPLARKLAAEHGVELAAVRGTGPGGRIIRRDVLEAVGLAPPLASAGGAPTPAAPARQPQVAPPPARPAAPAARPAPVKPAAAPAGESRLVARTVPVSGMRRTIARRLVESKTTIPHFTVTLTVDMDLLLGERGAKKQLETQGIKLSVNDFVARATALALVKHPEVNSSWSDQGIVQHGTVNLGVAVSLPPEKGGGLVVPTLRDCQNLGLRQINAQTKALAEKARGKGLTVEEMSDGTFTLSNLGMYGVEHFEAIINPPQAAILAVGAAVLKPVVRNGQIVVGQEMTLTLSGDHRVIDGAVGAAFLQTVKGMLENPAVLLV